MSGPILYKVKEAIGPLGAAPIVKLPIDVSEVLLDFSSWLAVDETIAVLSNFAILANPSATYPSWQSDFPFVTPATPAPADTNPLVAFGATVLPGAATASLLIGGGTPGLTYMYSFLTTSAPRQRLKEIDILISIAPVVNSAMITSTTPPTQTTTVVSATAALIAGTAGEVLVQNGTALPITITMPPNPILGQQVHVTDVTGNASTYSIGLLGASGALINGASTYVFNVDYMAALLTWTGSGWSVG